MKKRCPIVDSEQLTDQQTYLKPISLRLTVFIAMLIVIRRSKCR